MKKIPFLNLKEVNKPFEKSFDLVFQNFIKSGWYILGDRVAEFEEAYSEFNNVQETVGVANGLDSLIVSLKALNVGLGDEVIVLSNTYIASWLANSVPSYLQKAY